MKAELTIKVEWSSETGFAVGTNFNPEAVDHIKAGIMVGIAMRQINDVLGIMRERMTDYPEVLAQFKTAFNQGCSANAGAERIVITEQKNEQRQENDPSGV